jgi:hypothetical protein
MSRMWIGGALLACLGAFGIAYVVASPGKASSDDELSLAAVKLSRELPPLPSSRVPRSWHWIAVPHSPAVMAYPPGWKAIRGDEGTVSAALVSRGRIVGYLNATPEGGGETLANWLRFRPAHNREEGNTAVTPIAGSRGMHLRSGPGSCEVDDYTTASGARYRELACIVAGDRGTTVIVGTAPPADWARMAPVLRKAVSAFVT